MTYKQTVRQIHLINHLLQDPRISKETREDLVLQRELLNQSL